MILNILQDVEDCERNPVKSQDHNFTPAEKNDYDLLTWRGRTLYDNLRTQKNYSHANAYIVAYASHGTTGPY